MIYPFSSRSAVLVCSLLTSLLVSNESSFAAVLISIDQAGAARNINSTTSLTWNFTWQGSETLEFDSAEFAVRLDQRTVGSSQLIMTVYQGFFGDAAGNPIAMIGGEAAVVSVTATVIAALPGNGFKTVRFMLPASGALPAGSYSVRLTSTAENSDFNVKIGGLKRQNDEAAQPAIWIESVYYTTDETPVEIPVETPDGNSNVPEPSEVMMLGIGSLTLLVRRASRRARMR